MIARLCGTIVSKAIDQVIVDVNGVGYQVSVPLSSFYQLEEEHAATLQIYTHVREDALQLFGFQTMDEKQMFILLLSISGIGPKVALNILSHMDCHALRDCLIQEDAKRLATLPGIGKKTADRLILELREKVRKLYSQQPQATQTPFEGAPQSNHHDDALSALINLGYKEKQASAALSRLTSEFSSMEEMLKAALQQLSQ
nr:Holliday junction branch migration protein RuvA [uncultured Desulfuromonas sp.]